MPEIPTSKQALKDLNAVVENILTQFSAIDKGDLPALLKLFKHYKEFKEELDGITEAVSKHYNQLSYNVIPEAFAEQGVDSIKLAGRNFVVGVRFNASIPEDKKAEGFKWLEEHGLGALIRPGVNAKTLSSAISNYFEQTAEMPPTEAITCHKQTYTSVRKA